MNSLEVEIPVQDQFKISQAAKYLGKSVTTLVTWDAKGILVAFRDENNHRVYSRPQLEEFNRVRGT